MPPVPGVDIFLMLEPSAKPERVKVGKLNVVCPVLVALVPSVVRFNCVFVGGGGAVAVSTRVGEADMFRIAVASVGGGVAADMLGVTSKAYWAMVLE